MYRYTLVGSPVYTDPQLGRMMVGEHRFLPTMSVDAPKGVFEIKKQLGVNISSWGFGDKIYAIPILYDSKKFVIAKRDVPLFRVVKDNVIVSTERAPFIPWDTERIMQSELLDQIGRAVGTNPSLKLPILMTTEQEKKEALEFCSEPYVVVRSYSTDNIRAWPRLTKTVERVVNKRVVELLRPSSFTPLIERADYVITVNTGFLPMAGAFQVPVIAVGTNLKHRVSYFLESYIAEPNAESVARAIGSLNKQERLKCWCGVDRCILGVKNNIYIKTCTKCGTERQDVKLSRDAITKFYVSGMYEEWRSIIDGDKPYKARFEHDTEIFKKRLEDWDIGGGTWLDVGAGSGALVNVLKERGVAASGKDYCEGWIQDWKDAGKYDVITYVDSLEHIFLSKELIEARKHLNRGGRIIVELPIAEEVQKHYRRLQHLYFFNDDTFGKYVYSQGLVIESQNCPIKGKRTYILKRRG